MRRVEAGAPRVPCAIAGIDGRPTRTDPRSLRACAFAFPFVFIALSYLLLKTSPGTYELLFGVRERGAFEWVQFACYLIAAAIGLLTYRTLRGNARLGKHRLIAMLFAAGCAFIAAEEISWGQHLFQWDSPALFAASNLQRETNLHNIAAVQAHLHAAFVLVGLFGGLSWLGKRKARPAALADVVLPDWQFSSFFLPTAFFYAYFEYSNRLQLFAIGNHQELFESLLAMGFLLVALSNLHKAQRLRDYGPAAAGYAAAADRAGLFVQSPPRVQLLRR